MGTTAQTLELDDIQGTVLRQRPAPYTGAYFLLHVSDPDQGRTLVRRLIPHVASADQWWDPPAHAWLSVAFSHTGLQALGLPARVLDSFAPEFRQGMAARAAILGDTGPSAPQNWEPPFGTAEGHVALALFAADEASLEATITQARNAARELPGVRLSYELRTPQLATGRTHLGFVDGIGEPYIEGSGLTSAIQNSRNHYGYLPGFGPAVKAGEFVLGYRNELGQLSAMPHPEVLGRNGTYLSFRKLRLDVAGFRRFLHTSATTAENEELLAAKLVGRWRSGAPLVLAPDRDDNDLAADPKRVNDFHYQAADPTGLRCPIGAHIRRMNPRDSLHDSTDVQLHRILRRGATYGPALPEGVTTDDGRDRGIAFIFMGTEIGRQFEFVKSQWTNNGEFAGLGPERDPILGNQDPDATFTIPHHPIRRRLKSIPSFTRTCGGEYFFLPGLTALQWLAEGDYET